MYYERLIEEQIALKLKTSGAVVVAGPKFCGKTTTCMLYQKSFVDARGQVIGICLNGVYKN